MVFHKFDNLTSLALHIFPNITLWNLRWTTMAYEAQFPESERQFLSLDTSLDFHKFITFPMAYYFLWAAFYYIVNFFLYAQLIQDMNYDNMYVHMIKRLPWARKWIFMFGKEHTRFSFFLGHFLWFVLSHLFAIFTFYSYGLHTFLLILWLTWSIWNGSCFYMDYFSKKYE